jgi:hypothetical protein
VGPADWGASAHVQLAPYVPVRDRDDVVPFVGLKVRADPAVHGQTPELPCESRVVVEGDARKVVT